MWIKVQRPEDDDDDYTKHELRTQLYGKADDGLLKGKEGSIVLCNCQGRPRREVHLRLWRAVHFMHCSRLPLCAALVLCIIIINSTSILCRNRMVGKTGDMPPTYID